MDFNLMLQQQLDSRGASKGGNVERIRSRKEIEQALLETFELVGGIPRLAIWANDPANYGDFLKLLLKLAPKEQLGAVAGQILEYRSNIPQSPLNRPPEPVEQIEEGVIVDE